MVSLDFCGRGTLIGFNGQKQFKVKLKLLDAVLFLDEDNEFNDEASVADIVPSKFDLGADATKKTVGMNAGFSGRLNSTTSEVRSTLLRPPVVEQCSSSDEDDGFGDDDTCRPTSATIRSKGNDLQLSNDSEWDLWN